MDLSYSEDHLLFQQSLEQYLEDNYTFGHRRHVAARQNGLDPATWSGLANLGCFGVPMSVEHGGFDGRILTIGIVMQALGRRLVVEPVLGSAVICGRLIARLGNDAQRAGMLAPLIEGALGYAFAHEDLGVKTLLKGRAGDWRLTGAKTGVLGGATAQRLLVTAEDADGDVIIVILEAEGSGVTRRSYQLLDGSWAADFVFQDVALGPESMLKGDTRVAITMTLDDALVAACWEAVGAMRAAYEQTCTHVRERHQFDRPLAAFQVVQHKVAEMAVCCEEAAAAALLAALVLDSASTDGRRAVSAAKVTVGRCGRFVTKEAVQLHGAMGVSDELPIAAYFRKLLMFDMLLGSPAEHLRRYAQTIVASGAHETSAVLATEECARISPPAM